MIPINKTYPQCFPLRFVGWPQKIRVTCGKDISAPYSYGSRVILTQTPLSGSPQGDYVVGQYLPYYAMVYSDTGSDYDFNFLVEFTGYGQFYKDSADLFWRLYVKKNTNIFTLEVEKYFRTYDEWNTLIPASTDLSEGISTTVSNSIAAFYSDVSSNESLDSETVSGILQLNGNAVAGVAYGGVSLSYGV